MDYYDEDFYEISYEFEEEIEQLKAAISSSVRQKFLDEMDSLRKENEALRKFSDKAEAYNRELEQIKAEYAMKMRDAEIKADRKKLKDLMSLFSVTGYRVDIDYITGPKCDKCDDSRRIHYVSPAGRKMTEDCLCAASTLVYSPKEVPLVSFIVSDKLSTMYFMRTDENMDYDRYNMCTEVYDKDKTVPFEKINLYRSVFFNKEDCQRYCDWLNRKEALKNETDPV